MLFDLLTRPPRTTLHDSSIETRPRVEVCPPSLQPPAGLRRIKSWLRERLGAAAPFDAAPMLQANAGMLEAVREARVDFLKAMEDIRTSDGYALSCIVSDTQSLRELWHLRSKVFGLVAVEFSQSEANLRVERLNRHFPTRSPRSGLAPFDVMSVLDKQ